MVRFYLRFTGRVQGVGFRFFVAMNAERCHLTGWVKNMSDGSVTAEVQGTRVEIEKFLNLIQTGNRFVRVDEIEKEERVSIIDNINPFSFTNLSGIQKFQ